MKIYGLQKMTLLDFPGRVACTVFLGLCDFRCPYCHNFELADGTAKPVMEEEEFFSFLAKRKGLLDGVAVTGGEPCLHRDLPAFLRKVREMGFGTKLDTNGHHPELLFAVLEEGLADYVAMDVKNSPSKYAETIGLREFDIGSVNESIGLLLQNRVPYEFRTTVIREFHEARDFEEIGAWIEGAERYFLQPFADRDTVPNRSLSAPDPDNLREFRDVAARFVKFADIRGIDT